ncbi:succinate dehydrogenase hydrophobic membrane anchor subunit [Deinococcus roseus]|uniref:Succinate dehydrogenase n=1 Tax=Deinococcus roseus TaxID=392414 RepID=A0ABQ2CW59_9DEIO|nr:succinate dehydrogenase hydrophobic membrane anchor subunit [Deinococcus roseus]GGJ23030.1 succinate dehydrogenase [Deinococcus roseus]
MIRAKRFEDAKAQATGNSELFWWVFMRISGIVLMFLVLGHIYMTFIQAPESVTASYETIVNKLDKPVWKLYDWLIMVLAGLHGVNGARYVIEDYIPSKNRRFWTKAIFYTVVGVIFVWGTIGLYTFQPAQ